MPHTTCTPSVVSPCVNTIADPNFLVVPTGGCWARADFAEIVNRTVITKSIVAIDCADTNVSLSALIVAAANVIVNNGNANDQLGNYLNKLVNCIINNNGVISPSEPIVIAYVYEYNTQKVIASSNPPSTIIPIAITSKFDVLNNNGNLDSIVVFEALLANPSFWFEFVAPDVTDPTNQTFSYRFVSYASEQYRLVINVRLTPVPVLYPCVSVPAPEEPVDCCEDECGISGGQNWMCL
jgi:hypothetical protein